MNLVLDNIGHLRPVNLGLGRDLIDLGKDFMSLKTRLLEAERRQLDEGVDFLEVDDDLADFMGAFEDGAIDLDEIREWENLLRLIDSDLAGFMIGSGAELWLDGSVDGDEEDWDDFGDGTGRVFRDIRPDDGEEMPKRDMVKAVPGSPKLRKRRSNG